MNVRAKFTVTEVKHIHSFGTHNIAEVTLIPVWGNGEGNKEWSEATPQGKLTMLITNPAAIEAFELGKAYFLDFTPAD